MSLSFLFILQSVLTITILNMQEIENDLNKDLKDIEKDINFHRIIIF